MMAATPTTDPTIVPAIAPPLICFGLTGAVVAELLVDVLMVEVVEGS